MNGELGFALAQWQTSSRKDTVTNPSKLKSTKRYWKRRYSILERDNEKQKKDQKIQSPPTRIIHILWEMIEKIHVKEIEHTSMLHRSGRTPVYQFMPNLIPDGSF